MSTPGPMPPSRPPGPSWGTPLASTGGMDATTLRDKVEAELIARGMSWSALQKAANAGQKTITDIKNANPKRTFGHATLSKVDEALGLPKGTLFKIWQAEPRTASDEIAAQMRALELKLTQMTERPPWAAEAIEALAPLSAEDRSRVIDLARRLARP